MQGPHWDAGGPEIAPPATAEAPQTCASCDVPLSDVRVTLTRHRGEHRIPDAFCSVEHLSRWARSGGRYASPA